MADGALLNEQALVRQEPFAEDLGDRYQKNFAVVISMRSNGQMICASTPFLSAADAVELMNDPMADLKVSCVNLTREQLPLSRTQAEMMLRNASRADYDRWEAAAENSNMSLPDFIFKAAADRADLCLEPEATP